MIRELYASDIYNLIPLCKEHFKAVHMEERLYSFDEDVARATLNNMVANKCYKSFVIADNGVVQGIISFIVCSSPFGKQIVASEFLWYAKDPKNFIRLWDYAIMNIKADVFHVGIPLDMTVRKFLERRGFSLKSLIYSKEVS